MLYIMYSEDKIKDLTTAQLTMMKDELESELDDCIDEKLSLLEDDMNEDDVDRFCDLCELIDMYDDLLEKVKGALEYGTK